MATVQWGVANWSCGLKGGTYANSGGAHAVICGPPMRASAADMAAPWSFISWGLHWWCCGTMGMGRFVYLFCWAHELGRFLEGGFGIM